ncbi:bacterio-opsin activator domain-containing protein [Halostagnicola sp. A-GB9-2]|uniref:bacterio-opsin activator domain-containing protein n=1 Tax=Halostagnicola sp. A-GB9-2 TaxID=3048066 RepID=UPI0024C03194|nr:bacterio-opsin activator domain-containing protein [Halostagnicola sp. A-GB9-2]MDJ1430706.1 bacterio-opsin activator domain-containing protein [Halostagnicola sp. A-GB9-2]
MTFGEAAATTLTRSEYETLLEAAETYREALVVRLCGEVGLRPVELARLSNDDVDQVSADPSRYLLRIPGEAVDEETGSDEAGPDSRRTAYLPTAVQRDLERYVRSNDLDESERIFPVTPRRLQMLVSDVADRASERTNDSSLSSVSSSDLRHYFARSALVSDEINPRVVKSAGGWQSFEALEAYLSEPTDEELVAAFEPTENEGRSDRNSPATGDDGIVRSLLAATDRCALVRLDADGYVERWNRSAVSTFGYHATEIVGTHVSTFYADDDRDADALDHKLAEATTDSPHEDDSWFVNRDGSRFRATELIVPLRDETGTRSGFALFVHDVSSYRDRLENERSRNDRIERANEVTNRFRAVTNQLLEASAHDEVEFVCCQTLVDGPAYEFAWIDRTTRTTGQREWRTSSGIDREAAERLVPDDWYAETESGRSHRHQSGAELAADGTARTGEIGADPPAGSEVSGTDESPDGTDASAGRDAIDGTDTLGGSDTSEAGRPHSAASAVSGSEMSETVVTDISGTLEEEYVEGKLARVCLSYGDTVYGTLSVVTEREGGFGADELAWLETIGRQVGYAIAAVRRRNLLLSDTVVELEFACRDEQSFFVDTSAQLGCRFEIDSFVPVSESTQLYYVTLQDGPPKTVFELAEADPGIDDCRLIETYEDGWRVEFIVEGSSPTLTLTEYGVTVLETVVENGTATIAAECAGAADVRTIVDGLRSAFPDSELIGKREAERTVQTAYEFREGLEDRLTDRQESALRAAYFGGYYDWPRESTAEEVADAMGVSSPTLHNHLRKGQHELLRTFFDAPRD